jgi:hypothetical protein
MSIVAEFSHYPTKAISYSDRQFYMESKTPPPNWCIWIGKRERSPDSSWNQRYKHIGALAATMPKDSGKTYVEQFSEVLEKHKSLPTNRNLQQSFFCVQGFVFISMSTANPNLFGLIDTLQIYNTVKIWPPIDTPIDWSQMPLLTDVALDVISEILMRMNSKPS